MNFIKALLHCKNFIKKLLHFTNFIKLLLHFMNFKKASEYLASQHFTTRLTIKRSFQNAHRKNANSVELAFLWVNRRRKNVAHVASRQRWFSHPELCLFALALCIFGRRTSLLRRTHVCHYHKSQSYVLSADWSRVGPVNTKLFSGAVYVISSSRNPYQIRCSKRFTVIDVK